MVRKFIKWLKYYFSHQWCYKQMEKMGIAVFGCCSGIAGGRPLAIEAWNRRANDGEKAD